MSETYYVAVYWGIRKEAARECANRAVTLLRCFALADGSLTKWFQVGKTRQEGLQSPIEADTETIERLLLRGQNRTDFGQEVIQNLGFRIAMWTGAEDTENLSLNIKCGSFAPVPGVNSCVLGLPSEGVTASRLLQTETLLQLLACMIAAWDPDWGLVTSRSYEKQIVFPPSNAPRIGWITYISQRRGVLPPLPSPSQVVSMGDKGSIVLSTQDLFTVGNIAHGSIVKEIAAEFDKAGLMGPLQP